MTEFEIGEIVILKTDIDKMPRLVTKYEVGPGYTAYCLSHGASATWHYGIEITRHNDKREIDIRR